MSGQHRSYPNQLPDQYDDECQKAGEAGIVGVGPGPELDRLAVDGESLIYVITEQSALVVVSQFGLPGDVGHAVLARGKNVLAAGEVSLAAAPAAGIRMVVELNNQSGHYVPGDQCLDLAADTFRGLGFEVKEEVIVRVGGIQ